MSTKLIKIVFIVIGTLVVTLTLFNMIFSKTGQEFLWKAIEPAMLDQWSLSTMDNGGERTLIYENQFEEMKNHKFNEN